MDDRSSKKRKRGQGPPDPNLLAFRVVQEATGEAEKTAPPDPFKGKNPAAVTLGRLGGLKGGKARAEKLAPKQRSEIAKKAASSRWGSRTK